MVIGILGEKLAGKDTVAEYLVEKYGAVHIKTSKILDELLRVLGLPITRENEIAAGKGMEIIFGEDVIGEAVKKRVEESKADFLVLNGLRQASQFKDAKDMGAKIIYVTASPELRYQRALERVGENKDGRKTFQQFVDFEQTWTEVNIPKFGEEADFKIENTGSLEDLFKKVDEIIKSITSTKY